MLGLATVHGIIKQHKGWIEVSSRMGQGSEFCVYLPEAIPPKLKRAAVTAEKIPTGSETILVVEDEELLRKPLVRLLKSAGYQVHEASSAAEAIQQWQARVDKVDLLLTDMVMPGGVTGLELAENFLSLHPALLVIINSGYSQELLTANQREKNGMRFLGKPCDPLTLAKTIRELLDKRPEPTR